MEQCSLAGNFRGQSFALMGLGLFLRFELDLVAKIVNAGRVIIVRVIGVARVVGVV